MICCFNFIPGSIIIFPLFFCMVMSIKQRQVKIKASRLPATVREISPHSRGGKPDPREWPKSSLGIK